MGEGSPSPLWRCQGQLALEEVTYMGGAQRVQKKLGISGLPLYLSVILSRHVPYVKTMCETESVARVLLACWWQDCPLFIKWL